MTDVRQCWAFHKDGTRCTHPAGHPGNHAVERTWTDKECYAPIRHQLPEPATAVTELASTTITNVAPLKCVACGHSHKGGVCKCGCHEMIA